MKGIITSVLGFIVMGFLGLAANDYITQSVMARSAPGEFTLKQWADSFATRGAEAAQRAKRELRRDKPMRDYLPPAPPGWQRVEWTPEYAAVMKGKPTPPPAAMQEMQAEIEKDPVFKLLKVADKMSGASKARKKRQDRWVYLRGDKVVIVHAAFIDDGPSSGMAAFFRNTVDTDYSGKPIRKVHRGVAFREVTSRRSPDDVRSLRAEVDSELEIRIESYRAFADIGQIIGRIDVEGLRGLTEGDGKTKSGASHNALMAQMRREKNEERAREIEELQRIESRLARMAHSARNSGKNEVCLEHRGQQHCRWVD